MSCLKLNSNNDLFFSNNKRLEIISGNNTDEEIKQRLSIRIKSFKGEWFLNTNYGIPYFYEIIGEKNIDLNIIESIFKTAILTVDGVKQIIQSVLDYDSQNRKLTYFFQALTINNTTIQVEEII